MNKKFFQKSIYLLVTISFVAVSFLPLTNTVKADPFTQTYTNQSDFSNWTLSGVDKDSISGSLVLSQLAGGSLSSYSTSDTSKKDSAYTNANWNSDGSLSDSGISSTDLGSKLVSAWGEYATPSVHSMAVGGGKVFVGGLYGTYDGTFGFYDTSANTYTNLTSLITWFNGNLDYNNFIRSMSWDSSRNVLHILGPGSNDWAIYDPATNSVTRLTSPVPGTTIFSVGYDSSNGKTYAVTSGSANNCSSGGAFYTCPTLFTYDPTTSTISNLVLTAFMGGTMRAIDYNLASDLIFIGGNGGMFAKYNPTNNTITDLTSYLGWQAVGGSIISDIASDSTGVVYVAGNSTGYVPGGYTPTGGIAMSYNDSTMLSATIVAGASGSIQSVEFDSSANAVYFGGMDGYIYKYNVATSVYDNIGFGSDITNAIFGLSFDSSSGRLYLGTAIDYADAEANFWFGYYSGGSFTNKSSVATLVNSTYGVQSVAVDATNENVYVAGISSHHAKYNISSNSVINIPASIGASSKLAINPTSGELYVGGSGTSAYFGKYNPNTGILTDLTPSLNWGTSTIDGVVYNSNSSYVFLVSVGTDKGEPSKAALYNTVTGSFTNLTIPWSIRNVETSVTADSRTGNFYIGRASGSSLFYVYNPTSNAFTDLTSSLPSSFAPQAINYNSYDQFVYMGSSGQRFVKYSVSGNSSTEFTSQINFWGSDATRFVVVDSLGDIVYFVGDNHFGRYDPETNLATDLTSDITWNNCYTTAADFDLAHDTIYIGGCAGYFQKHTLGSTQIKTTTLSSSDIKEVYLTSATSPSAGKVKYYASNNGGTTFSELTSSAPVAFTSSGNDLQIKTVLAGGASISAPTINFSTASVVSGTAKFIFSSLSKRIWQSFVMDSSSPAGSSIAVSYRTADTQSGLNLQNFVQTSGTLAGTSKYIEFSIQLIASGGVSPAVRDFQLVYQAEAVAEAGSNPYPTTPSPSPTVSPTASSTPLISPSASTTATSTPKLSATPSLNIPSSLLISPAPVSQIVIPETITESSSGKYVAVLQGVLKDKGYLTKITQEGAFDDNTKNAVAIFQKDNGINPLKIIGPRSKAVLNNQPIYSNLRRIKPSEGQELLQHKFTQNFKFGDQNDEISILQKVLYIRSFFFGPFSGYFGPITKSAVEEFQKAYDLNVSGQLDKNTQDKLNSL